MTVTAERGPRSRSHTPVLPEGLDEAPEKVCDVNFQLQVTSKVMEMDVSENSGTPKSSILMSFPL